MTEIEKTLVDRIKGMSDLVVLTDEISLHNLKYLRKLVEKLIETVDISEPIIS